MGVSRLVLLALMSAAVIWETASCQEAKGGATSELRNAFRIIAGSNLNFTNALYQVLSRTEGNVFFSPLSIQVVLALATQGAGGETQREMIEGLRLPEDQQITKDGFRQLLTVLKRTDGESVKIANKIYTDRKFPPTREFVLIAQESFHSDGEKVNFERDYDQVRQQINRWVESNTANKIRDLLPQGSLSSDTAMVLVNAVYFKGTWVTQFDPSKTKPRPFFVNPQVQRTVNMMHVKVTDNFFFKESEELNANILEIPYIGNSMSLVIILPNERFGLRDVETKLARMDLRELFKEMHTPEIHVRLPKFKLEQSLDLKDTLQKMGMQRMFSNSANFSGLAPGAIKVSKVVHKAFIDVNEEGAEAAASTGLVFDTRSVRLQYEQFNADHPFIFFLCHTKRSAVTRGQHKNVVFIGRYSEP